MTIGATFSAHQAHSGAIREIDREREELVEGYRGITNTLRMKIGQNKQKIVDQ